MNPLLDSLDQVVAGLDRALSTGALAGQSDSGRMEALHAAGEALRRVEAVILETVASADQRLPEVHGCRSMNELLQRVLRLDAPGASRVVKAASAVRREVSLSSGERLPARYPSMRTALLDGAIGIAGLLAATAPIEQAGDRIGVADRLAADAAMADFARGHPAADADADAEAGAERDPAPPATPDDLRQFAQVLAMTLDPDGAEPSDLRAQQQRFVTVGRLRDGVHSLRGALLPDAAAQLELILDAQCNPKTGGPVPPGVVFRDSEEETLDGESWNTDPRHVIDPRTAAQKRHDALVAALGIAARHDEMPALGGAAPTLVVQMEAEGVATGAGWATIPSSQAPVPLAVAAQVACAGAIQRVLTDEGRIIGVTVTDRVFTVHQRRAIVARDGECVIPGCHVPATWCEIHHVIEHARGGPTHTDNGVPLCWWHHRSLDSSGWEIRMSEGLPQIRGPAWWDPTRRWRTPHRSIRSRAGRSRGERVLCGG
ncbi:HNH endonuclease signature motif containing protein [Microbacterium paraoxydans]|uniref:HNH endonuclease signature motif containing protein n=1 Tax=Microbacterium paraoxydans TaxID=199592 RepID=UPI001CF9CF01|nr:HNH endonuclease signature motif containing protein [Microbacterium paraoxydans]